LPDGGKNLITNTRLPVGHTWKREGMAAPKRGMAEGWERITRKLEGDRLKRKNLRILGCDKIPYRL